MFDRFNTPAKRGSTYLEIQVAMILMSVGVMGLYATNVVQSRQSGRLSEVLPAADTAAINQATSQWARKLGHYGSVDATVIPTLPAESHQTVWVVDDQDSGFTHFKDPADTYGWTQNWSASGNYQTFASFHLSYGNVGTWAQFEFNGLPPDEYTICTTFFDLSVLGDSIEHEIYDGPALLGSHFVDQRQDPTGVSYNGRDWLPLGTYEVNSGQLRVRLLDGPGATDFILADAMLLIRRPTMRVVSVSPTSGGGMTATLEPTPGP